MQYLDVNKVSNEGHEDHLISVPALPGVHLNPALQLPPLATITHEDLKEGARMERIEKEKVNLEQEPSFEKKE